MDFFWNVFYKKGTKENEEKELKIFHEFDEDMYNFILINSKYFFSNNQGPWNHGSSSS